MEGPLKPTDRRSVVLALAATSTLPLLALPTRLAARTHGVTFPVGKVTLERELERELGGGAIIKVLRRWDCRFETHAKGASVHAKQIACVVDAPPALASFAKMEREREVTGLFPMALGPDGMISNWGQAEPVGIAPALRHASARLSEARLADREVRDARQFVAQIGQTAAHLVSQVPRDLFFPEDGKRSESKTLALPDGGEGSFEIIIAARTSGLGGFLKTSERRIITRIGDSARTASERWSVIA